MAIPAAPSFASFDVTSRTEGRSVDSVLWDAMFPKSRLLQVLGQGPTIKQQRHEWIGLSADPTFITATNVAGTTVDGSDSGTDIVVSSADAANIQIGTILMNYTRATPIGTYQRNELLLVTGISGTTVTCTRDYGSFAAGAGSTSHAATDKFRIVGTILQEGSSAASDPNTYLADTILENYTRIQSMKMQLTGSQKARAMEVVDNEVERQWARSLLNLKNQMSRLVLYGVGSSTAVGSDSVIRDCKGIEAFMVDNLVSANPLVDYTTTSLTYSSINNLLIKLANNGADPESTNLKIVTSYKTKDVMGGWDVDKVRTTLDNEQVGREISVFKSTLGFQLEIIADPIVDPSDLFIIDPAKIKFVPFRTFEKSEWGLGTPSPNGDDMWYQRTIGEYTVEVVDPGVAHAMVGYLSW